MTVYLELSRGMGSTYSIALPADVPLAPLHYCRYTMERAIDPLREENQFLVLARESIDFEIRRNTDASAGGDDYASRILLATFEERIQSFRDARDKPFDAAFEILSDGEFVVYHVGIRHVEVGDDLIIDFRAPIARERFSEAATERDRKSVV